EDSLRQRRREARIGSPNEIGALEPRDSHARHQALLFGPAQDGIEARKGKVALERVGTPRLHATGGRGWEIPDQAERHRAGDRLRAGEPNRLGIAHTAKPKVFEGAGYVKTVLRQRPAKGKPRLHFLERSASPTLQISLKIISAQLFVLQIEVADTVPGRAT